MHRTTRCADPLSHARGPRRAGVMRHEVERLMGHDRSARPLYNPSFREACAEVKRIYSARMSSRLTPGWRRPLQNVDNVPTTLLDEPGYFGYS